MEIGTGSMRGCVRVTKRREQEREREEEERRGILDTVGLVKG